MIYHHSLIILVGFYVMIALRAHMEVNQVINPWKVHALLVLLGSTSHSEVVPPVKDALWVRIAMRP